MAITVDIEKIREFTPVTIQTPYYYKHDLSSSSYNSMVYGKITDTSILTIQKSEIDGLSYQIIRGDLNDIQSYSGYLTKSKYVSSKEEFDAIAAEMKQFIESEA